jgi:hypothetical protein
MFVTLRQHGCVRHSVTMGLCLSHYENKIFSSHYDEWIFMSHSDDKGYVHKIMTT